MPLREAPRLCKAPSLVGQCSAGLKRARHCCRARVCLRAAIFKKAIMGGKINIKIMFFRFLGESFREIWGELGGEGYQKALNKH